VHAVIEFGLKDQEWRGMGRAGWGVSARAGDRCRHSVAVCAAVCAAVGLGKLSCGWGGRGTLC
jgi:hypothetical protein